jgi:alcohol dehydrogenase class IV
LPFTESCAKHVSDTFNSKWAYIIASTSLSSQTSHVKDLEVALGSNHVATWTGIPPHTPWDDLLPIINDMRAKSADWLITLGSGSLTDGVKVIIYAVANGVTKLEDLEAMVEQTQKDRQVGNNFRNRSSGNEPTDPIICIPTTLSAGEYTPFGGGTNPRTHQKSILMHPNMYPSLVILDLALTTTTPEWVWISTGVRSIDHCVEEMCSLQSILDVDEAAEKSLELLLQGLLRTKKDPTDSEERLDCQLAANYVTRASLYTLEIFLATGSHGIGHRLGPLGVGHGQTSCVHGAGYAGDVEGGWALGVISSTLLQRIVWGIRVAMSIPIHFNEEAQVIEILGMVVGWKVRLRPSYKCREVTPWFFGHWCCLNISFDQ